jgi:hypothetical protein
MDMEMPQVAPFAIKEDAKQFRPAVKVGDDIYRHKEDIVVDTEEHALTLAATVVRDLEQIVRGYLQIWGLIKAN